MDGRQGRHALELGRIHLRVPALLEDLHVALLHAVLADNAEAAELYKVRSFVASVKGRGRLAFALTPGWTQAAALKPT